MAFFRCGGGAKPTKNDIYVRDKTPIQTLNTPGASWTATEDCVMAGVISATSANALVTLDGINMIVVQQNSTVRIGVPSTQSSTPTSYGMFIPKGVTIATRELSSGTYDLNFYSLN